jgi:hypothetical protein
VYVHCLGHDVRHHDAISKRDGKPVDDWLQQR